ncbi:hypothetical protein SAMN05428989_1242 [Pseudoxanthomonas sp. GM95]|nr:hypothetical protein SAMN05428989_1242 [Pseudoxanthomonas sp. GM95]
MLARRHGAAHDAEPIGRRTWEPDVSFDQARLTLGLTHPQIVGFDLPSPMAQGRGQQGDVLVAMLDGIPAVEWRQCFLQEAARRVSQRQVADLRLVGATIASVAGSVELRLLPALLQDVVFLVNVRCQRLLAAGSALPAGAPVPTGDADATDFRQEEVRHVAQTPGMQHTLERVAAITGMRFVAIARIADKRWTALAVHDLLNFGLHPGQDLLLESTICNEIRGHGQVVTFNQASTDKRFATHPTPALYGFESYISVPLILEDGEFFGTLFALDIAPAALDAAAIADVTALARELARSLSAVLQAEQATAQS